MNRLRLGFFIPLLGIAAMALGQTQSQSKLETLKTLRSDLHAVQGQFSHCLGIYEGHLGKARGAVRDAANLVNAAVKALEPPPAPAAPKPAETTPKPQPAKKVVPAKTEPAKAPAPAAKKEEIKKVVSQPTVPESQASFREGLAKLEQAIKDLKAASDSLTPEQVQQLTTLLQTAETESKAGIEVHAKEG